MHYRRLYCTHCGQEVVVSTRVISTSCCHCHQRIAVEDHTINAYHAVTNIETSGSLAITPTGHVRARLRVHDLQVAGQVYGNVTARGKVSVDAGARIVGDVTAQSLEVQPGAHLKGFFRIEPENKPSPK
jgi:hypothetical protein